MTTLFQAAAQQRVAEPPAIPGLHVVYVPPGQSAARYFAGVEGVSVRPLVRESAPQPSVSRSTDAESCNAPWD